MVEHLQSQNDCSAFVSGSFPERVVQFGGGNFLRAFVDWIVQILNEETDFASSVVIIKPTASQSETYDHLNRQAGLFHVQLHDFQNGQLVSTVKRITCVSRAINPYSDFNAFRRLAHQPDIRFIISNTTETGFEYGPNDQLTDQPPVTFPAKLTQFLYNRFLHFQGRGDKGCIVLPCELLEGNGDLLRQVVLRYAADWRLSSEFANWVQTANRFCNTLVDRIVPGAPKLGREQISAKLGFDDPLLIEAEQYHSWVIEAKSSLRDELPVHLTNLNVRIVDDVEPYRRTKVRILNGAHTAMMPLGYMLGLHSVQDSIEHPQLASYIHDLIYSEIIPSFSTPGLELEQFAADVLRRFHNPFLQHKLTSIALKSVSKFRIRLLPSLFDYVDRYDDLPRRIVFAFAALICFYKGIWQGRAIPLDDDLATIAWFKGQWASSHTSLELAHNILANQLMWGQELTTVRGLETLLADYIALIESADLLEALQRINR